MEKLLHFWPQLASGLVVTLATTAGAAMVAAVAAITAGQMRDSSSLIVRFLTGAYIEIFRGTSALIQLFWLFFVLPLFGIVLPAMTVGILGLGLCIGAYGAEAYRSAKYAVPRGQREAADSLGLSRLQGFFLVQLPQAFRIMLPQASVLSIELLKASALVSLITLHDLSFAAQSVAQETYKPLHAFGIVLVVYYTLSRVIAGTFRQIEHRLERGRSFR